MLDGREGASQSVIIFLEQTVYPNGYSGRIDIYPLAE